MTRFKYMLVVGLLVVTINACSPTAINTPELTSTDVVEVSPQATAMQFATQQATLTSAPTPTFVPTGTTAPLTDDDAFLVEMRSKGYNITQSGSIIDKSGNVYSAYIFREPWENQSDRLDNIVKETWVIAFYRWDGKGNELLSTHYLPVYDKRYPDFGFPVDVFIVNWDDPFRSFGYIDFMIHPDEYMPSTLRIDGFASDINHNDKPEFMFTTFYCPVSCSRNRLKTHIYEISSDSKIVELAADLPGHIDIKPVSFEPLVYSAVREDWYGFFSQIHILNLYQWQDDRFVDITLDYEYLILEEVEARQHELQASFGQPIVSERAQELMIEVLLMYQEIEMREKGVEVFLELTDAANWPGTEQESLCWLEVARVTAQDEFERGEPFSIPHSTFVFNGIYLEWVQGFLEETDLGSYDLSACAQE